MCALFLANRSPRLEDLTTDIVAQVARRDMPFYEDEYAVVSRVLVHLGMLSHPIAPSKQPEGSGIPTTGSTSMGRVVSALACHFNARGIDARRDLLEAADGRTLARASASRDRKPGAVDARSSPGICCGRGSPHRGSLGTSLTASRYR